MPQEKNHDWRGPGKTPVRNLAKVGVGGSNPLARSKFPVNFKAVPGDGPEQGFVHWRETGAKLLEQKIDRADRVLQIGRIEGGIELGGAVIARLVAKLLCFNLSFEIDIYQVVLLDLSLRSIGSTKKGRLRRPCASCSAARCICRSVSRTPI